MANRFQDFTNRHRQETSASTRMSAPLLGTAGAFSFIQYYSSMQSIFFRVFKFVDGNLNCNLLIIQYINRQSIYCSQDVHCYALWRKLLTYQMFIGLMSDRKFAPQLEAGKFFNHSSSRARDLSPLIKIGRNKKKHQKPDR